MGVGRPYTGMLLVGVVLVCTGAVAWRWWPSAEPAGDEIQTAQPAEPHPAEVTPRAESPIIPANIQTDTDKPKLQFKSRPPVLGSFRDRYYQVRIHVGDRYTILDAQGEVLAELISATEFSTLMPDLFKGVQQMLDTNNTPQTRMTRPKITLERSREVFVITEQEDPEPDPQDIPQDPQE